ncbi:hypothetical protein XENTR_v10014124 [Xenopus tropicalis]|nr:hypothetical protein XENTR_v10014124 [Xenopus tropicalis]
MEKGKKSGLRKLSWLFSKTRSGDVYNEVTMDTSHDSRSRSVDDLEEVIEIPSNELCSPKDLEEPSSPAETKKKSFGSWKLKKSKRKTWNHISTSPPSSPGLSEKSNR